VHEVAAAANIYVQLIKSFVNVAEDEGIAGKKLEMRVAEKRLTAIISDTKKPRSQISYPKFADSLRNTAPFSTVRGHRTYIRPLMKDLQDSGFIVYDKEKDFIYINPKLKD
jgi:hypothetical protein